MIDLNFGLWWSGSNLSYLRYLTFKTLRHFHPDSRIQLFVADKCRKKGHNWAREKQEFESNSITENYMDHLKDLDVEVRNVDMFSQYAPNYQSDFFRWWYLKNFGGFYLDTDQIILKSFETLPLDNKLIYCSYGNYSPVGVIGGATDSEVIKYIVSALPNHYDPNDYNSCGPWMFRDIMKQVDMSEGFNAPQNYFYPISTSEEVPSIYSGNVKISKGKVDNYSEVYSCHWFGGHPDSQKFNAKYNEGFAYASDDSISRYLKEEGLI